MGFYQPAQIISDAWAHGVAVHPVDVHASDWECSLQEDGRALRLGTRLVKGLSQVHADALAAERERAGPYTGLHDLHRRSRVPVGALRRLARGDAFGLLGLDRQRALWGNQALKDDDLPVLDAVPSPDDRAAPLPPVSAPQQVRDDYHATGLSLKAHPVWFLRELLNARGVARAVDVQDETASPHGKPVLVAGVVLVRQRPATASGIVFITLEDETGIANLIVRPKVYERCRSAARHCSFICAKGRIERAGSVVHVQVTGITTLDTEQDSLFVRSRDFH